MSKRSLIDSIDVKSPCSESWDRMTGSEQARFCGHCAFEVNNLSALTRKQATRLVHQTNGRICVRYVKNPATNAPVFADRLYKITRRTGLAAGVLGATLAAGALGAQAQPNRSAVSITSRIEIAQIETADKTPSEGGAATLSGTIADASGALIPNPTVTLILSENETKRAVMGDENGFYQFEIVPAGKYRIEATATGFTPSTTEIEIFESQKTVADLALAYGEVVFTLGELAVVEYATPLFTAVSMGEGETIENLLARGENPNARDENYNRITPLFLAVENGSAEIAETLLNYGAKINVRDNSRQTPLMRIDEDATTELVDLLIKHGARVNLTDKEGNTALILAAVAATPEVLQILIRHSASVNARNAAGQTALMAAAEADNLENVRALLSAGADANVADNDGETALSLTTDDAVKELLKEYGAEPVSKDSQ